MLESIYVWHKADWDSQQRPTHDINTAESKQTLETSENQHFVIDLTWTFPGSRPGSPIAKKIGVDAPGALGLGQPEHITFEQKESGKTYLRTNDNHLDSNRNVFTCSLNSRFGWHVVMGVDQICDHLIGATRHRNHLICIHLRQIWLQGGDRFSREQQPHSSSSSSNSNSGS